MMKRSKIKTMELPTDLRDELDALVRDQGNQKRWTDEAEAVLAHYYTTTDASVTTLCKILEKAFPGKSWPYSIVNSKIQYLKNLGCFSAKKDVD